LSILRSRAARLKSRYTGRKHTRMTSHTARPLNTQDFIREFVRNEKARYIDLGNYDMGMGSESVYVRSKLDNDVMQLDRSGIRISHTTKVSPSYYIAAVGLLAMAFYFSVFFMRDALGDDLWLVAILGIFLSPFLFRFFTSGFKVIGLYFAVCILFSVSVGSWQENEFGSGVLIFYVIGLLPYLASRIFRKIWSESLIVFSSGPDRIELKCPESRVGAVRRMVAEGLST
jgi:hypothetical protein